MINKTLNILLTILFICQCSIKTDNFKNKYIGKLKILSDDNISGKFDILIDYSDNINLKLYSSLGLKICDVKIYDDSLKIIYLIADSYKNNIIRIFNDYNKKICLKKLINEILKREILKNRVKEIDNINCFKINNIEDNGKTGVVIFSNDGEKLINIFSNKKFMKRETLEINVWPNINIEAIIKKK